MPSRLPTEEDIKKVNASLTAGLCGCWQCFEDRGENPWHMVLCPMCGNKRCPHASNHRYICSCSNLPGQPGSVYE